jgi:hypothetical protein
LNYTVIANRTIIVRGSTTHFTKFGIIIGGSKKPEEPGTPPTLGSEEIFLITIELVIGVIGSIIVIILITVICILCKRKTKSYVFKLDNLGGSIYLPDNSVEIEKKLGEGHFGQVYQGSYQGTLVALKKLHDETQITDFFREASILLSLRHPNIVWYYGIYKTGSDQYIVTELLSSNLNSFLKEGKQKISLLTLIQIAKLISSGMNYLETQKIIHCDLASRNVLVKLEDNGNYKIKVADFGLSSREGSSENRNELFPIKWTAIEGFKKKKKT